MIIAPPAALVSLAHPWNKFYSDSKLTETIVLFAHIGGLVIAGGVAIATDRLTLRSAAWTDDERRHHLSELAVIHRTVVAGLTIIVVSGVALFLSDVETFWGSRIFWVKLTLIVLLLANGGQMVGVEKQLATDNSATSIHWGRLRTSSIVSMTLWLSVALAGVALANFA